MTLNTERDAKETLRRRASTPIPSRTRDPGCESGPRALGHPALGHSASYQPGDPTVRSRAHWSSDSEDSDSSGSECLYRVVLLGDHGVGKSSLAGIFAGIVGEKDANDHLGEDTYERTLTVDGEETTLIVMDTWETEKQEEDEKWVQDYCMQVGNAYVIVYSITDRSSFESASELRIQLRRMRQAENIPIILVGNKSDLVRCREVAVEDRRSERSRRATLTFGGVALPAAEGRACAVVFDCKFIETSASLHHNVHELFEGIVRQIRLRRDSKETNERRRSIYKRKESITKKARRFLDRLVARNNKKMALKVRSKSCHDLSVL
ncbi:GTP-binding protein REM 1-like [Scleropages formosus]|uniref:GTP-binding protein n=1 Tax=Scleropages formosus TaxID=113540 RepID=A0A0P7U0K0_SCLFO|nr:GTP-binding protein REM 1-like [Scleropages formosus]